ncbi:glutaredoxin, partial [Candidatus Peregrinibacteria bacterium]|nr:glutaredoxin [Candidatus Peregrinibacteria bacterium]
MFFKKFFLSLFAVVFLATPAAYAIETPTDTVRVEVFERQDCGHCQAEKKFLNDLQKERGDLIVVYHDISESEHKKHFLELMELEKLPKVTPVTIIDGVLMQGFDTPETTGKKFRALIDEAKGKRQYTFEEFFAAGGSKSVVSDGSGCTIEGESIQCSAQAPNTWITIPVIGKVVDVSRYSLGAMSLVLGFVDGFNPCAMWVLVMFLTILAEAGSRRKMFQMAGIFILAEA